MGLSGFFFRDKSGQETPVDLDAGEAADADANPTPNANANANAELAALRARVAAFEAAERDRATQAEAAFAKATKAAAESFAKAAVRGGKLLPTEKQADLARLHERAAYDDRDHPAEGLSRVAALESVLAAVPERDFRARAVVASEMAREDLKVLGRDGAQADPDGDEDEDRNSPEYKAALEYGKGRKGR